MNGLCYLTLNTSDAKPLNIQKIAPLRFKGMVIFSFHIHRHAYTFQNHNFNYFKYY